MTENFDKYKQFVEIELELSRRIAAETAADKDFFQKKFKELLAILRTPRLYNIYTDKLRRFRQLEEQKNEALRDFKFKNQLGDDLVQRPLESQTENVSEICQEHDLSTDQGPFPKPSEPNPSDLYKIQNLLQQENKLPSVCAITSVNDMRVPEFQKIEQRINSTRDILLALRYKWIPPEEEHVEINLEDHPDLDQKQNLERASYFEKDSNQNKQLAKNQVSELQLKSRKMNQSFFTQQDSNSKICLRKVSKKQEINTLISQRSKQNMFMKKPEKARAITAHPLKRRNMNNSIFQHARQDVGVASELGSRKGGRIFDGSGKHSITQNSSNHRILTSNITTNISRHRNSTLHRPAKIQRQTLSSIQRMQQPDSQIYLRATTEMSEQPIVNLKTVQDDFQEPQRADYIGMKVTMACMHNKTSQQPQLKQFEQQVLKKALQTDHVLEHHHQSRAYLT